MPLPLQSFLNSSSSPGFMNNMTMLDFFFFWLERLTILEPSKGLTLEGLSKAFKLTHTTETKRYGTRAPQGDS